MMKKVLIPLFVALMTTVVVQAQQIAVVTKDGATTLHRTLQDAIEASSGGSVIYLPGGGFPISDEVIIDKRITIVGIGHKVKGENADGYTTINGNLQFGENSDKSAVMGCYITGNVSIGVDGKQVNDILVRYCNLSSVRINNSNCHGTEINQNYIRTTSWLSGASATFSNNILYCICEMYDGTIKNNVVTGSYSHGSTYNTYALDNCKNCSITDNVILTKYSAHNGSDCQISGNMSNSNWGESSIKIEDSWSNVFENNAGANSSSSYHFKEAYKQYETQCGIYGGTGFSDGQLPPAPFIVEKSIPEQTDASGNLNIRIRVKAGE
jgi:hypothetical protein